MIQIKTVVTAIILCSVLLAASPALAQQASVDLTSRLTNIGKESGFGETPTPLAVLIGQIIRVFLSLLGVIFLCYTIYAGFLWLTASGDENKIEKSRGIIRGSIIGLVIVFAAFAITSFVLTRITETAQVDVSDELTNVSKEAGFGDTATPLPILVGQIIRVFLSLLGIVFMAYIVYAGFLWLTARGDENKIEKSKAIIRGSIIGLIIVFAAYAITGFILTRVTDTTQYNG